MENGIVIPPGGLLGFSMDDYEAEERGMLTILQEHVTVTPYKNRFVLAIHPKLYDFLYGRIKKGIGKGRSDTTKNLVQLVSLMIAFADPRKNEVVLYETDLAKLLDVSVRMVQRYLFRCDNVFFLALHGDNLASYFEMQSGKTDTLLPVKYQLMEKKGFSGFDFSKEAPTEKAWVKFKYNSKELVINFKIDKLFLKYKYIPTPRVKYGRHVESQVVNNQLDESVFFEHFNNPIYEPEFDVVNTPYPVNWCRHPDPKAYFNKGRWYHGSIHGTKKDKQREMYLEYKGLTHEIYMHNAMFYFMFALLSDPVSKEDKAGYYETVKAGTLYDDCIDFIFENEKRKQAENKNCVIVLDDQQLRGMLPSRDEVKMRFQIYRNIESEHKEWIRDIAEFMGTRFPTVHEWMLEQIEVLQNRLAWCETDFMTFVGERLAAEKIRFDWLHDAVYVSEADSARAQEIWDSVRDEFEKRFAAV